MAHYLVVDVETTGLNPFRNQIISLGASVYDDNTQREVKICDWHKPISKFCENIIMDSRFEIEPTALKINRLRISKDSPTLNGVKTGRFPAEERDVIRNFVNYVLEQGKIDFLMGFNVQFDLRFLEQAFRRSRINFNNFLPYKVVDPFVLCHTLIDTGHLPNLKYTTLKAFCSHFGIEVAPEESHTVLGDIHNTYLVYQEMKNLLNSKLS